MISFSNFEYKHKNSWFVFIAENRVKRAKILVSVFDKYFRGFLSLSEGTSARL